MVQVNFGGLSFGLAGKGKLELIEHKSFTATSPVSFTGISGYKYLMLVWNMEGSGGTQRTCYLNFNGDSGNNYTGMRTTGTAVAVSANQPMILISDVINNVRCTSGMFLIAVDEKGTNSHGVSGFVSYDESGNAFINGASWVGAAAITTVSLYNTTDTLTGVATLYGLKET